MRHAHLLRLVLKQLRWGDYQFPRLGSRTSLGTIELSVNQRKELYDIAFVRPSFPRSVSLLAERFPDAVIAVPNVVLDERED